LNEAWEWVNKEFPFPGYIAAGRRDSYVGMAYTAWRTLGGSGKILDFGCGPLDKTALFARLGLEIVAFDDFLDWWHREGENLGRIKSFAQKANIKIMVADEHPAGLDALGGGYDMIMLHHVLEHLKDSPRDLLNALLQKLKPEGFLYVTVPNAVNLRKRLAVARGRTNYSAYASYYWAQNEYRGHIREYVRNDLVEMARFLGLEVVEAGHYNHFLHAVPKRLRFGVNLLCRAVPGFCDSCSLVARKPRSWSPKDSLTPEERDALDASGHFDVAKVLSNAELE